MKTITYKIRGMTPLMMHSERLANPFDDVTRAIKAISGKRKKTEDDLLEMARLEHQGGLYFTEDEGVHIPGYNVFAAIIGGGKLHKLGTAIKRAALVNEDHVPLEYDGPTTPDGLFADKRFVDMRGVKVGTAKIMRCRPIFKTWGAKFTVTFDESSLQRNEIDMCVRDAGAMVGLCEYRPRFGRFEVVAAS